MKIAIILPHFYPYVGGGEKMFYDLALGLLHRGHQVHVVAREVAPEHVGHRRVDGLDVWYCPWRSAFGHPLPRRRDIEPHIRWCDVVHSSIFTTAPIVSRLAHKYHKRSVLTVYEVRGSRWFWLDAWYRALIYYLVEQISCRQRYDSYHAISEATKRDYERFIGRRDVRRVYLADEAADVWGGEEDFDLRTYFDAAGARVFLYYGRPGKTKGTDVYLRAIKILHASGTDLSGVRFCFLLGSEPAKLRTDFLRKVERYGLTGIVRVRQSLPRAQLLACIAQADCVVVPSTTEGFGYSALEASQVGTPLIYSDAGSLPEVAYGRCKSFPNRDAQGLADTLYLYLAHGVSAFETVPKKRFSYGQMLDGIEDLYLQRGA